jgi:hypothetical protein
MHEFWRTFAGGSVNTRSRSAPKKKGADYSANAGLMFFIKRMS